MLKFFRKIRQRLLSENRFKRYLPYAIGEIFLVVIGILIALAINNWNEKRKDSNMEIHVLIEISENLGEDIISLENDVRLNENGIRNVEVIENVLASGEAMTDTLLGRFGRITFNPTYSFNTSGYKNLTNIGFQIIAEDSIRKSLTYLYENQYSFLKEREETMEKVTYEYLNSKFQEYFKEIKFVSGTNEYSPSRLYYPKNYEDLNSNPDFQMLLDYSKEIKYGNLYDLNMVLNEIRSTKETIDSYLSDRLN